VKICAGFKSKDGALSLLRNLVRPPVLCCSFPWTNHTFAAVIRASVLTKHGERPGSRQDGTPHHKRARPWPSQGRLKRGICSCATCKSGSRLGDAITRATPLLVRSGEVDVPGWRVCRKPIPLGGRWAVEASDMVD
jgi:hypothetical protein